MKNQTSKMTACTSLVVPCMWVSAAWSFRFCSPARMADAAFTWATNHCVFPKRDRKELVPRKGVPQSRVFLALCPCFQFLLFGIFVLLKVFLKVILQKTKIKHVGQKNLGNPATKKTNIARSIGPTVKNNKCKKICKKWRHDDRRDTTRPMRRLLWLFVKGLP